MSRNNDSVFIKIRGERLEDKDFWSKSDPFLVFLRSREDGTYVRVHNTEVIPSNLNPIWNPFKVKLQTLCNGDIYRPIKIECWDHEGSGKHDYIGEVTVSINDVMETPALELKNPKKMSNKKYKNSGILKLD